MIDYGFNTEEVEYDAPGLPVGTHLVLIDDESIKKTPEKTTNPQRLVVTFKAVEGEYKGKTHMENYNLWNTNQQAANIAKQTLKRIADATGREVSSDSPLKGRLLRIEIGMQKGSDKYTEIKKYLPEKDNTDDIPF